MSTSALSQNPERRFRRRKLPIRIAGMGKYRSCEQNLNAETARQTPPSTPWPTGLFTGPYVKIACLDAPEDRPTLGRFRHLARVAPVVPTVPPKSLLEYLSMTSRSRLIVCFVCGLGALAALASSSHAAEKAAKRKPAPIDFNRDIRPILSDKCIQCHGPDSAHREADLRLDREQDAKADRDGVPAVVPGKPDESALIQRITSEDVNERMPPEDSGKTLTLKEIELLKRWINEGAEWMPAWAYVPPKKVKAPKVKNDSWPINWIDRFALARIEAEDLTPSSDADKITLIRRLSIDLTGLSPTPEEVDDFTNDERPDAYERLVDRLLASHHFGERMAVSWLDWVRYADTVGYHGDQDHNISPYRDYVIDSFNQNLRFDQFTREQLAGDLLPSPTLAQTIATGYNRLLQTSHEGGIQAKEYLAIYAADRVRNLSAVWMGATVGCAQCHDHKYDPYTSKDFYAMQAFFADVDEARHFTNATNTVPTRREPELELLSDAERARLTPLEAQIAELKQQVESLTQAQKAESAASESKEVAQADPNDDGAANKSNDETAAKIAELRASIGDYEKQIDSIHKRARRTMITVSVKPRTIRVLPRGNWMDDSGEIVEPTVPGFLPQIEVEEGRATRLDLANWLTDSKRGVGGQTARVMVNRFWQMMFGRGLARVLDDFGGQGEPPVDLKLLDSLALEFMKSRWDVKHMMKLIAMSRTYRQASQPSAELLEEDPLNLLFARQSQFRYPAESVRDSVLAISDLLVDDLNGPSVKPYQPAGYYRHLNFPEREYKADSNAKQWRRGVYMHWQRQFLHPMLKAFDAPSREECTAERPRSNTPLAALVLLNDPTFVEASHAFAAKILTNGGETVEDRVNFAFRNAVSRQANPDEQRLIGQLLDDARKNYAENPQAAKELLAVGLKRPPKDLDPAELASWTIAARTILSMSETLTRN